MAHNFKQHAGKIMLVLVIGLGILAISLANWKDDNHDNQIIVNDIDDTGLDLASTNQQIDDQVNSLKTFVNPPDSSNDAEEEPEHKITLAEDNGKVTTIEGVYGPSYEKINLDITCKHEVTSGKYIRYLRHLITDESGSYSTIFDRSKCGAGDIIQVCTEDDICSDEVEIKRKQTKTVYSSVRSSGGRSGSSGGSSSPSAMSASGNGDKTFVWGIYTPYNESPIPLGAQVDIVCNHSSVNITISTDKTTVNGAGKFEVHTTSDQCTVGDEVQACIVDSEPPECSGWVPVTYTHGMSGQSGSYVSIAGVPEYTTLAMAFLMLFTGGGIAYLRNKKK